MAVTATTNLGATDLTPKATFATGCYLNDWFSDPLKIKRTVNGSAIDYHNHRSSSYSNKYFDVREIINNNYSGTDQWCREHFSGSTAYCGYKTTNNKYWVNLNGSTVSCTYGQIKITSGKVTASRDYNSSKTLTIKATLNYQITQAPIESYYNWRVYVYFQRADGEAELQKDIFNRSKSWSTGTGSKSFEYSFEETSGKTSLSSGRYGIWGGGNGVTYNMNPSMGVGKDFTINIPKYMPSPVKYYNGTSWSTVPIKRFDGSNWVDVPIKQFNGSTWINI